MLANRYILFKKSNATRENTEALKWYSKFLQAYQITQKYLFQIVGEFVKNIYVYLAVLCSASIDFMFTGSPCSV